jgi:hypothetical protein
VIVKRFEPQEWELISEKVHDIIFNEIKPSSYDRIGYALLATDDDGTMFAYMTCRENDSETVYWQYGGSFPAARDTIKSFKAYQAFARWHSERYKRVVTLIENTNFVMLKMAMKIGFKIIGIRNYKGDVLLEHLMEFKEEK